jgi:hypothetical protein
MCLCTFTQHTLQDSPSHIDHYRYLDLYETSRFHKRDLQSIVLGYYFRSLTVLPQLIPHKEQIPSQM